MIYLRLVLLDGLSESVSGSCRNLVDQRVGTLSESVLLMQRVSSVCNFGKEWLFGGAWKVGRPNTWRVRCDSRRIALRLLRISKERPGRGLRKFPLLQTERNTFEYLSKTVRESLKKFEFPKLNKSLKKTYLLHTSHLWVLTRSAPRSWRSFSENVSSQTTSTTFATSAASRKDNIVLFVTFTLRTSLILIDTSSAVVVVNLERIDEFLTVDLLRKFVGFWLLQVLVIWILTKSALLICSELSAWIAKLAWRTLIRLFEHCLIHSLFGVLKPVLRVPLLAGGPALIYHCRMMTVLFEH